MCLRFKLVLFARFVVSSFSLAEQLNLLSMPSYVIFLCRFVGDSVKKKMKHIDKKNNKNGNVGLT